MDALFEMRFAPQKAAAGDLLPGLLYRELGAYYQEVAPMPLASVPRQMRDNDTNLRYMPAHKLAGKSREVQVGDRVVLISQKPPYEGWRQFHQHIRELVEVVKKTNLIEKLERYSLKCVNVIEARQGGQLSLLNAKFELTNRPVPEQGFRFRTEFLAKPYVSIVQLATNATAEFPSGTSRTGLLVEVDTIRMLEVDELLNHTDDRLNHLHQTIKPLFFSLLAQETIEGLGPIWEEK